ncbi:MAG: hypothetical protein LBC71_05430 [Oscillospiraceae bacterium]|nr:hypothetical protein [Oscillospiraceae bacterium]
MKKKLLLCISIAIIAVFIVLTAIYFFMPTQSYSDELSRTIFGFGRNFSQYGMLAEQDGVMVLYDFHSSNEVVFCPKPECTHDNNNCFAYAIYNMYKAINVSLYNDELYFTTMDYDFNTDYGGWSVSFYRAAIDGATVRKIETFEGYRICYSIEFIDGYAFLNLEKYDETQDHIISLNERFITKNYVQINLSDGNIWFMPEKQGYYLTLSYIGFSLTHRKFYYIATYHTIPTYPADNDFKDKYSSSYRSSLIEIDIDKHTEAYFLDRYTEMLLSDENGEGHIQFTVTEDILYVLSKKFEYASDVTKPSTISSYNIEAKELLKTDIINSGFCSFLGWGRHEVIITYRAPVTFLLESMYVFNPLVGETTQIGVNIKNTVFMCQGDRILLMRSDTDTGYGAGITVGYYWMYTDDYLNDDISKLFAFNSLNR